LPAPDSNEILLRLRRLPRQLLMALINGTAILVIVAATLALVATSKVTHLAENVASTMTDAVLARIDVQPQQFLAGIHSVGEDVHALAKTLKQAKAEGTFRQDPEIERLTERLGTLQASIGRLGDARSLLVEEAIARVARAVAEGLENFRACSPAMKPLPTPAAETP
jgi:hypothetical protein